MEITSLRLYEFYIAIGWLARENKVYREGELYKLGITNLTFDIGRNAGMIWNLLNFEKKVGIQSILESTQINKRDTCLALGWLARENKIKFNIKQENNSK
jgi:hypothetical protein